MPYIKIWSVTTGTVVVVRSNKQGLTALDFAIRDYSDLPEHADDAMIAMHRIIPLLRKSGAKTGKEVCGKTR